MRQKIGIVVATKREQIPFIQLLGKSNCAKKNDVYDVMSWTRGQYKIYIITSGYGEIAAAAATQHLIDKFKVSQIINYGVAGSLTDEHLVGDVGIVRKIVHYGFDLSGSGKYPAGRYPNQLSLFIRPKKEAFPRCIAEQYEEFICASADKFVEGGEAKRQLRDTYSADICEMEAAGVVITCNKNNIPCSFIKAISDGANEGDQALEDNISRVARYCAKELKEILKI